MLVAPKLTLPQAAQQMANRFYGSRLITVECPKSWFKNAVLNFYMYHVC